MIDADTKISMDGKGAWRDNIFVERIWKSVKYEEVYLRAYASVSHARTSINGRAPGRGVGAVDKSPAAATGESPA